MGGTPVTFIMSLLCCVSFWSVRHRVVPVDIELIHRRAEASFALLRNGTGPVK